jgi:hypothetical protein
MANGPRHSGTAACQCGLAHGDAGLTAHMRGIVHVRSSHRAPAVAVARLSMAASVMRWRTMVSSSLRRPRGGRQARRSGVGLTLAVARRGGSGEASRRWRSVVRKVVQLSPMAMACSCNSKEGRGEAPICDTPSFTVAAIVPKQ